MLIIHKWDCQGLPLLRGEGTAGRLGVFHQLLEQGEDLASQDKYGNTALHYLCEVARTCTDDRVQVVERFLERGASVSAANLIGETPLRFACTPSNHKTNLPSEKIEWDANRVRIARTLLDAGALENAKCKAGWTPLDIAMANPNRAVLALLRAAPLERQILAFAMCQHARLGEDSPANVFDDNVRSLIFAQLSGRK